MSGCQFDKEAGTEPSIDDANAPHSPSPENNITGVSTVVALKWQAEAAVRYDLYFGESYPPNIIYADSLSEPSYLLTNLKPSTTYYWQVIAYFNDGSKIAGPIWSFTTTAAGQNTAAGYVLKLYKIETAEPSDVRILLQALDLAGKGVTDLQPSDFEVFEDGEPLSPSESQLSVIKKEGINYKLRTVLLLDNSTSLKDNIDEVRRAASEFISNKYAEQEIAILQFSEQTEKLANYTSDTDSLLRSIQRYQTGYSSTDLYGAVIEGASLLKDVFTADSVIQSFMILFTDGRDTQGSHSLSEAVNSVYNKIVFAVGLGQEIQPAVLNSIGTAGYYPISRVSELNSKFEQIKSEVDKFANSFYLISYKSPKRGDKIHTLMVRIKNNSYNGDGSFVLGTFNSRGFYSK
ncbi:putative lipoprotein [Melioribacter roseus P3M-2]|uniref:Putative lipoprotein n=2 Tax=Melioribacteraceae TaxID=1334117 RepID=I6ZX48_MELRP|nr:putative lipoprotein [Melioribacter roseus P3M-2]